MTAGFLTNNIYVSCINLHKLPSSGLSYPGGDMGYFSPLKV
jgi:hypothetical protein